ncbi:MAG: WD40 repeat domain-containing protein [Chloroflexi bacterium]|nr:WD40 repeat domain-containing protein [Chloroflexota bacterium]
MQTALLAPGNASRIRPLRGVTFGWISQLRWSPSGDMLAIAGGEGLAVYRGGFGGTADFHLRGHSAPVKDIAFHPDGQLIASCSADTRIKLWKIAAQSIAESATLAGHPGSVEALAWHPDGSSLASGGADGSIRLWDAATGAWQALLAAHADEVTALAFDPSGRWLFSGSRDNSIRRWDIRANYTCDIVGRHDDWVREIALSPAGFLASASKDMSIRLWDMDPPLLNAVDSGIRRQRTRRWKAHAGGVDALAFSPDGSLLVSGGRDNCLRIWETETGRELAALAQHRRPLLTLALHPAGGLLATGGGDNRVLLWAVPL